ncbi:hypothetical protein BFC17_09380 [Alteromonas lipolytica]|uniref:Porin domain-containing protein n=1 Tax=Alteromonas lipolytica TaxID=1856405 RepID=A0A1E8FK65_9ALTE|nr:hypothetical protein BFC17_09380 [Alteromonas lipolytica]
MVALLALPVSFPSVAQLAVSGFATLGLTTSNNDELIFRTSINRWPETGSNILTESLVGIQFNYQASDKIDFVVQSILENKNYDSVSDYVELAFMRYQIDRNFALRIGRMNYNAYILSEYLDVGYSYLWATPPMEFYSPSSYLSYFDGVELQYRNALSEGVLQATFAAGTSKADLLSVGSYSSLEYDYMLNTSVSYETDNWLFKGTLSHFSGHSATLDGVDQLETLVESFPQQWWPFMGELLESLEFKDQKIHYAAVGVNYNDERWFVKSELAYFDIEWGLTGDLGYGYVSSGYEFDHFTPYITFALLDALYDRHIIASPRYDLIADPATQQMLGFLQTQFQGLYDSARMDQYSVSVGARWDFHHDWALKGQFTRYRINGPGAGLWGRDRTESIDDHKHVNVISININTVF